MAFRIPNIHIIGLAIYSARAGDKASATMLFSASRSLLGNVNDRTLTRAQKPIAALSRAIANHASNPNADRRLLVKVDALGMQLHRLERQSLYDPQNLARALNQRVSKSFNPGPS